MWKYCYLIGPNKFWVLLDKNMYLSSYYLAHLHAFIYFHVFFNSCLVLSTFSFILEEERVKDALDVVAEEEAAAAATKSKDKDEL